MATRSLHHKDFMSVIGSTGKTLFILPKAAKHSNSMKELIDSNLRPLTYQEIIPLLINDEALRNRLKGKWFWLEGWGTNKDGMHTVDEKGELKHLTEKEEKILSIERKIYVLPGEYPLTLHVYSDNTALKKGRRFDVGTIRIYHVATVVVGVPKNFREQIQTELEGVQIRKAETNESYKQLVKREKELKRVLSKADWNLLRK